MLFSVLSLTVINITEYSGWICTLSKFLLSFFQRPIVVQLSRERSVDRSVCLSVRLSSALWKNGGSDPYAIWHHRSDGSRDEAGSRVLGSIHGKGVLLGVILGCAIVTSGDFMVSVCDSALTIRAAVWGGTCGGPRHCCIRWGPPHARGREISGIFVLAFSQWEMPLDRRR